MVLTARPEHSVPSLPLIYGLPRAGPRSEALRHSSPEDNSAAFNEPLLTSRWMLRVRLVKSLSPTPLSFPAAAGTSGYETHAQSGCHEAIWSDTTE